MGDSLAPVNLVREALRGGYGLVAKLLEAVPVAQVISFYCRPVVQN
jgi:hypothetical protein